MRYWVGTSGFSYKEWKGSFYPEDLPNEGMLEYYGARLNAVEINNTFYRMPSRKVLADWASKVPSDFSFVLKASRKITHNKRLKDAEEDTEYKRYKITESGVSPRAVPGLRGYNHVASTDEHDEDGTLLSDEFTNPHKRRNMVGKRARKFDGIEDIISAPELEGPADAEVTLVGWGSTYGVVHEAIEQLEAEGVTCNHLPIKWIVPFHSDAVRAILESAKKTIVIENTHSGQFYRFMRSEIGLKLDMHIRKYDGEPFMPYQVVDGVKEILAGKTEIYVPTHPIMV